jgi:hypothetical protein
MILHDRFGNPVPVYCDERCKKKPYCRLKYRKQVINCENKEEEKIEQNKEACDKTSFGA